MILQLMKLRCFYRRASTHFDFSMEQEVAKEPAPTWPSRSLQN